MNKQSEPDSDPARTPIQKETIEQRKRPYRAPRLVTYGNLRELALAKGGLNLDGPGSPRSKV
jgi:hypothetical protein